MSTNQGTSPLTPPKGGTNSAFVGFTGPTSSMKTFTLPNTSGTLAMLSQTQTWTAHQTFASMQLGFSTTANGTRIDARDSTLTNNTAVYTEAQRSVSSVVNDTVVTVNSVSATAVDAGAGRFVMRNLGTANSFPASTKGALTRALEGHTLVDSSIPNDANRGTWIAELGLHSQLAGNGADKNVGIYLASSHTGWLPTGVRNDTGLLILGEDGWTNAIRYYDTNGTTILFNVDQTGTITAAAAVVGNLLVNGLTQLKGTQTNSNAAAGDYGEYVSSTVLQGSAVALTTCVAANVTSVSLTAGDWDVSGTVAYAPGATTNVTLLIGAINTVSATVPTAPEYSATAYPGSVLVQTNGIPVTTRRISIASTTTVYLIADAFFTVSGCSAFGIIRARRVR